MNDAPNTEALKKLRDKFPDNQISKLPKPTKKQTDDAKTNTSLNHRCTICGGWHHKDVIHLDYVGHAALTARLLDVDPMWTWEPFALDANGLPAIDKDGGLWIKLTVCGITRLGYGDAQGKAGGDAMKERIGDALRNAAMRFGAALDLWHKGDLHIDDDSTPDQKKPKQSPAPENNQNPGDQSSGYEQDADIPKLLREATTTAALSAVMNGLTLDERKPHTALFNQRMGELKKAA